LRTIAAAISARRRSPPESRTLVEHRENTQALRGVVHVTAVEPAPDHVELAANGEGVREEVVIGQIEDAQKRQLSQRGTKMDMSVAVHRAAVGRDAPRGDLEQRRFAGAVATEHHAQLPGDGAQ
jgi:hypothetical protein